MALEQHLTLLGTTKEIQMKTKEEQMTTKEEQMTTIEKLKNAAWAADAASIAAMEAADVAWESYIDARRKSWAKGEHMNERSMGER
jgi:hypothetical protein